MATHMKTLGCRGVVCDGPARDFDEIREMNFQLLCTGGSPGHGSQSVMVTPSFSSPAALKPIVKC